MTELQSRTIPEMFQLVAAKCPDRVALTFDDRSATFRQVESLACGVANGLVDLGVRSNDLVVVWAEASVQTIAAYLGVLMASAAYVPLDPDAPAAWVSHICADAGVALVLVDRARESDVPTGVPSVAVDSVCLERKSTPPTLRCQSSSVAYVSYTSGSTGPPKGVAVPHRAVINLAVGNSYLQLSDTDVIAQASNLSFDASTFEIWTALLNGLELAGIPKSTVLDPAALTAAIAGRGVTTLFLTTALFNHLVRFGCAGLSQLRYLLFGGEPPDKGAVRILLNSQPPCHLLHVYGPTEATTFATCHPVTEVDDTAELPIGRPLDGVSVEIVDAEQRPVDAGTVGEIRIGGLGVALGYHKRPELTARAFWPAADGARFYRTGDLGRMDAEGSVTFVGRDDNQVKIRGVRVELGEVEQAFKRCPGVRDCVVVRSRSEPGSLQLTAFVVQDPEFDLVAVKSSLPARLRRCLRSAAIPEEVIFVDALPLGSTGKVDRGSLERMATATYEQEDYVTGLPHAVTPVVAMCWYEVLGKEVAPDANFFDAGGTSLSMMHLQELLNTRLGTDLSVVDLFRVTSIREQAAHIAASKGQ